MLTRLFAALLFVGLGLISRSASALSLNTIGLETRLSQIIANFQGRVGICISDGRNGVQIHGNQRFPLDSVSKVAVAVAVLDGVDKGRLHLDDAVTVRQNDLGIGVQPLAKLVGPNGFKTNLRDLLFRMIVDSDGAATDFLMAKVGGPNGVQKVLEADEIKGFKIDRDERDLDADESGLRWDPKYANQKELAQAMSTIPEERRADGFHAAQGHDTGTPIGVANLLQWLANGQLLSRGSAALLLEAMTKARSFPDRLRAGVPNGWLIADKTGTGVTWKGVASATNDVGILMAPDASSFVVVVVIADSKASDHDRAALIANVARAVGECSQ